MFSAAEAGFNAAVKELRDEFGPGLNIQRLSPDVGVIGADAPGVAEVAEAVDRVPLVFIRHLTREVARVPVGAAARLDAVVAAAVAAVADEVETGELSLQVWVSGEPGFGYGSRELSERLADELRARGNSVVRSGNDPILSCCITPAGVSIGLNTLRDSLSDWPGGRIRLARGDARVSRAEFKLEELFQTVELHLPERGRAVDFGASPGGWTRILRQRGLTVWAVDPGDLDPRVAADRGVHHVPTTAAQFLRQNDLRFDVAVNDMRMEPALSCEVMLDAATSLKPGALAIVTLKVGTRRPVDDVRRCLGLLGRRYEVVFARQLQHNRQEVTVAGRRTSAPPQ
jgi:23S rRNA (cytidine2498-2'-O)-methyltransferase